jgi:lactoylglutathione lyase
MRLMRHCPIPAPPRDCRPPVFSPESLRVPRRTCLGFARLEKSVISPLPRGSSPWFGLAEKEKDMPRIVHIALKVPDLDKATKFYEDVFGFRQTGTGYDRGHVSRHMTDGNIDLALMVYDSEEVEEAQLSGAGPCIHHWGIEVDDRDATAAMIEAGGGKIISREDKGAWKFRAPDGTVAEIVKAGRYKKKSDSASV